MVYILNKISTLCRPVFGKNITSGLISKNMQMKTYDHLNNTNRWAEQKYKLKDNISKNYRLVYRERTQVNVIMTAMYYLGYTGLASFVALGYWIYKKPEISEEEKHVAKTKNFIRPLSNLESAILLFSSFTMSILLIVGTRSIPFRIYYNSAENVYKAVFVHRIFVKQQIETFRGGTVVPLFSRKKLGDVFFKVNGHIIILDGESFPVPDIRERMIRNTE